jgi:hypothetical protein
LLPGFCVQLDAGEVEFGPITLSTEGVTFRSEFLPFEKIKSIKAGAGWFACFVGKKKSHNIELSAIPNYLVLLSLLEERKLAPFFLGPFSFEHD